MLPNYPRITRESPEFSVLNPSRSHADPAGANQPEHGVAHPSVKTFLTGLFDYAGLFPPADLAMKEAVHEYLDRRSSGDRWMLGPFVIPMDRLNELRAFSNLFDPTDPFPLDVLLPGADSADPFTREVPLQLANCRMFSDRHPTTRVVAFETKLPRDVLTPGQAERIFEATAESLSFAGFGNARLFVELESGPTLATQAPAVFEALSRLDAEDTVAAKLRCGGMKPDDFPPSDKVAAFIGAAAKFEQPFKLTAGLHHPVRHRDKDIGAMMHGFLNLLFATVLALEHDLDVTQIQEIIEEEEADAFVFEETAIRWRDLAADIDHLGSARNDVVLSIGSCSFDEPRSDLVDLGWLLQPGD